MNHANRSRLFRLITCAALLILPLSSVVYAQDSAKAPKLKDLLESEVAPETTTKPASPVPTAPTAAIVVDTPAEGDGPHDKYNRTTPYGSFQGLRKALIHSDYRKAYHYVDFRNLPREIEVDDDQLLRHLKIILDRVPWIDARLLSSNALGHKNDGLPSYRDLLISIDTSDGDVRLYLQRVPGDEGATRIWKLSNHSIAQLPALYEHYGYGEVAEKLSHMFPEGSFLGLEIWQWLMLLGMLLVGLILASLVTRVVTFILRKRRGYADERLRKFINGPVRFVIVILLVRSQFDDIVSSPMARAVFETKTLMMVIVVWLIMGLIDLGFGRLAEQMKNAGNEHSTMLLRPAANISKILIILIALMSWLDNLGFSVATLIAGLGVGGIALGLAAQKSIENLIGAFTIYIAQPIRVGDFCRVGTTLGVIEEIGLRSTLIRTLDRTIVNIPNGALANMNIENITKRDKILFKRTIQLKNDSSAEQVRLILENIQAMFKEHEHVDPNPARIRFIEYGEYSLNLEAFSYVKTTDFNQYLTVIEDLNLRILEIIEAAGTRLAVPARNIVSDSRQ
ncbi:MAG: mechanosensitive ion channel family protein [Pseudomonadales bacterium]|nr:mechanosensitive ion channel family protein [Pseudomonadales bacterium]